MFVCNAYLGNPCCKVSIRQEGVNCASSRLFSFYSAASRIPPRAPSPAAHRGCFNSRPLSVSLPLSSLPFPAFSFFLPPSFPSPSHFPSLLFLRNRKSRAGFSFPGLHDFPNLACTMAVREWCFHLGPDRGQHLVSYQDGTYSWACKGFQLKIKKTTLK